MRHQQRGGHSFARHIAKQKYQFPVVLERQNQVAVVTAHGASGLVLVVNMPVAEARGLFRQ